MPTLLDRLLDILATGDERKAAHPDDPDYATEADLASFDEIVDLVLASQREQEG
jgi:hypothetical protein